MRGGPNAPFSRIKHIWQDDDRGYLHGDRSLLAFDTTTGAILWTFVGVGEQCSIAGDESAILIEEPNRYRRLDPATGAELPPIANAFRECTWNGDWPTRLPPGIVEADHFFVFQPLKSDAVELQAIHIPTGAVRWRRGGLDTELLLADQDAVYVTRGEHLVALDAATGTTSAEISLAFGASNLSVHGGVGDPGPLLVALNNGEWILGRAEQPPVPESFRVRGRLVPDGVGRKQVANVRVRVGERRVRTDADGRFEVRGRAIGALAVDLGTDRGPDQPGGSRVRFEPVTVVLDGSGNYDVGDISLSPWYVE
jgi:outer membrane protein assembly factor BamB